MRVLVACEFSGTVRDAFIQRGHDAVSCDLLPSEQPGPIRHREDLEVLPKEDPFVFQDHLPAVSGGLVRYWKDRGLIQRVGTVRKNGSARRGVWELTDKARRILG